MLLPSDSGYLRFWPVNAPERYPAQAAAVGQGLRVVVVAIEDGLISTKGDANNSVDQEKQKKVDGLVLFGIPKIGYGIDFIQSIFRQG